MHHRTITAVFKTMDDAERAAQDLAMRVGGVRAEVYSTATNAEAIRGLSIAPEDRDSFDEAMRRGHAVVSAQVPDDRFDQVADALEGAGAMNLDDEEESWRREGWTGGSAAGMAGSAAHGHRSDDPPGTMLSRGVDDVAGTNISGARPEHETRTGMAGTVHGMAGTATRDGEAIPIVEERLRVGKREVAHGRVRVRSYVVETPVEEQVRLHQEHVDVERRAVDRPVTDADRLFQERTIEATETAEEAVVSKEARVKEEVVLRKHEEDRTETVRDSVRRTEVEVEDERQAGTAAGRTGTGSGTASGGTATPGTGQGKGSGTQRGSGTGKR